MPDNHTEASDGTDASDVRSAGFRRYCSGVANTSSGNTFDRDACPSRTLPVTDATPVRGDALPEALRHFGDYELLQEFARGGMGVIYRARQISLNRTVALKMILSGHLANEDEVRRFSLEAEAAASLQHPHIVAIHDVGVYRNRHYFTMDFVEGRNLVQVMDGRPLPLAKAAAYVKTIAEATEFAHSKGILHRDLKPQNVLIDENDRVRITDFGLAKQVHRESGLTLTGTVIGSPNYMSPEQAQGLLRETGPASDVYSLGAILYELITGGPPFRAATPLDTMRLVVGTEPVRPRSLNPAIAPDLETICLKCLEKDPSRRYPTARALADDLGRFLGNEPIRARPAAIGYRIAKFLRRNKGVASVSLAGAAIAISLLTGWIATLHMRTHQAEGARKTADEQRRLAEDRELTARRLSNAAQMSRLYAAWLQRDVRAMTRILNDVTPPPGGRDLRGWEWYTFRNLAHRERRTLSGHTDGLTSLSFHPDGDTLATCSSDGTVRLWHPGTGADLAGPPGTGKPLASVAFSPDGRLLAVGDSAGNIVIRAGGSLEQVLAPETASGPAVGISFSSDGALLAASRLTEVAVWDTDGWTPHPPIRWPDETVESVAFSPTSRLLALAIMPLTVRPGPGLVRLRDPDTGEDVATFGGHTSGVVSVAFTPDGDSLVSGGRDGTTRVWDLNRGTEILTLKVDDAIPESSIFSAVAVSPDGSLIAAAANSGGNGTVLLWEARTGRHIAALTGHTDRIRALAFSPDGRTLASAGADGTAKLWTIPPPEGQPGIAALLPGYPCGVETIAFQPDGKTLASFAADGVLRRWDLASGTETDALPIMEEHPPVTADMTPDASILAVGTRDRSVTLWDMGAARPLRRMRLGFDPCRVALSPSGDKAVVAGAGTEFELWDVAGGTRVAAGRCEWDPFALAFAADGTMLATGGCASETSGVLRVRHIPGDGTPLELTGHAGKVRLATFSPDGKLLASAAMDRTLRFWDTESGREREESRRPLSGLPYFVRFSPDGRCLVTSAQYGYDWVGAGTGMLSIWCADLPPEGVPPRPGFPRNLVRRRVHSADIRCGEFAPDGRSFVTGSADGTLKVWDTATWQVRQNLPGAARGITSVAFSPTGTTLAVGRADFSVRIFDVATHREQKLLTGHTDVVCTVAFSPDGASLASGSCDATVRVWDVAAGKERLTLTGHPNGVRTVAFSPDGHTLASGNGHVDAQFCYIRLWDARSGAEKGILAGDPLMVRQLAFSPDGNSLAAASGDGWPDLPGRVRLWDMNTGKVRELGAQHRSPVLAATFSPDGTVLATGNWDREIVLYRLPSGEPFAVLDGHEDGVAALCFSADGKTLVSGSLDGTLRLWDLIILRERATLKKYDDVVTSVAFSPDGTRLVVGCADGTLELWQTARPETAAGRDSPATR